MKLRTLIPADGAALLAFEIENRDWFERFIPPRPDALYSEAGMAEHIAACLADHAKGAFHPCVMVADGGKIVGRANLRDMDLASRTAKIGYRVAERHAGRGLAGAAVAHLQGLARSEWRLERLYAHVTPINPASARVLEKSGFVKTGLVPEMTVVKGITLGCHEYVYELNGDDGERR
ncbi:MAG TPA: GNAT family protein [Paucimonas sp.]|nr:GNAT family protein [Paucimonas sp.]